MQASAAHARPKPILVALVLMALAMGAVAYLSLAAQGVRLAERSETVFSKGGTEIDYGNSADGYIMVKREKASKGKRLKLKVIKGDDDCVYDLNTEGKFEVFPLQMGNGKYKVQLWQQVKGDKYSQLQSKSIDVKLSEKYICYLYPNQYVMYDADSQTVKKSMELCEGLTTDEQKFKAIYAFCSDNANIRYDYIKAMTVKKGYLPEVDAVLKSGAGICFDYAAVMACMLRVQGIPTQLVIGYADKQYHAWNKVLLNGEWVRYDATFEASGAKVKAYTEERSY